MCGTATFSYCLISQGVLALVLLMFLVGKFLKPKRSTFQNFQLISVSNHNCSSKAVPKRLEVQSCDERMEPLIGNNVWGTLHFSATRLFETSMTNIGEISSQYLSMKIWFVDQVFNFCQIYKQF